ncbi:MAG TPA: hypothetical protein EYP68_06735 [Candidatus Korarchaeota archaeon]|nr:hypothetical protein [Candidatus Korarchaeota archaeon]
MFVIELHTNGKIENLVRKYLPLISSITMYEYLFGETYRGKDLSKVKSAMERVYEIIHVNQGVLEKALNIDVTLTKEGAKLAFRDPIIGATAIKEKIPLITGNVRHFSRLKAHELEVIPLDIFLKEISSGVS